MLLFLRFLRFLIVSASLISAFKFVQISSTIKNNNNLVGNNNNRLNSQSSALKLALNTSIQKKLLWLPNLILNLFKFTKKSLTGQKLRDGIAKFYDESSQIWYYYNYYPLLFIFIFIILYLIVYYQAGCMGRTHASWIL